MKRKKYLPIFALLMVLFLVGLVSATGVWTSSANCCYVDSTKASSGYYNETTELCYYNSSQAADGYVAGGTCSIDMRGLPHLGTDTGDFLSNFAPGVGVFIIILGIFGGISAIVYGIVWAIRRKVG